ncbi:VOC family protein [Phenylobacterium sp.]|uniref:VOC family protein n=1 Tax=Phenylobacterium sp. TaxID=1871053 RepID=UPI0025D3B8E1|nr:VOC family protein [Phenylobacterium sp.]MBX3483005.1 VOC family protein [Phenylobacterium sp.]MCW5759620.1 VOC family protein [Phenylobacterium sp.]
MSERPAVVPCVFYKDPIAALKWLEQAFGFELTVLLTDAEGNVGHSEMAFLNSAISVGGEWAGPQLGGASMKSPASLGGAGTQFLRIALPDGLDAHCERARAAGARITAEPEDQFYGDRTYRAMDPEGHIWNFSQAVRVVSGAEMEQASGLKIRTSLEGA